MERGAGVWNSPSIPNRIIKKPSVHINGTAKIWYMWARVSAAQSEHIKRWIIIIIITIIFVYHPTDDIIIKNFDAFEFWHWTGLEQIHVHFCTGVYDQNRFAFLALYAYYLQVYK